MWIDIFFLTKPTEKIHHSDKASLYAVAEVRNSKSGTYWHAHVTQAQYDYRVLMGLPCLSFSELATKYKIKIKDKDAKDKDVPLHCFGQSTIDFKMKKMIEPKVGTNNVDMTASAVPPLGTVPK
jgi:hypothetical protein